MKVFLIGILAAGLGLVAQTPKATVRINASIMGFVPGAGPSDLRAVLGIFGAARISQPLAIPETVTRLYLAPSQRYALVEQGPGKSLAIWNLDETVLTQETAASENLLPIPGAFPDADLVAFSPRGESAAVYSKAAGQLQIIGGLPGKATIGKLQVPPSPGVLTMIALTGDASVVITQDSTGDLRISNDGKSWRPFIGGYSPLAWSFLPNSHDLLISDTQEKALLLIEQAESKNTRIVLADACEPDRLAVTSNGETLVALDSTRNALWTVDLKSRTPGSVPAAQDLVSLLLLRNGNTFLVSSRTASPSLLKISGGAPQFSAIYTEAAAVSSH